MSQLSTNIDEFDAEFNEIGIKKKKHTEDAPQDATGTQQPSPTEPAAAAAAAATAETPNEEQEKGQGKGSEGLIQVKHEATKD